MCFLLAMWVACHQYVFTIIKDLEFHKICQMLYAKMQLPLCMTLSCNIQAIFAEVKGHLIDYL